MLKHTWPAHNSAWAAQMASLLWDGSVSMEKCRYIMAESKGRRQLFDIITGFIS